jgi:thioredoxin reductase (NADPH)
MGFPEGIPGNRLAEIFREQAYNFNIHTVKDEISEIRFSNDQFHLKGDAAEYRCKRIVIATGTKPHWPDILPKELIRSGLIHPDISQLAQVKGKSVGIIGAGDAAFDYALSMAQQRNSVSIFNRSNEVKALLILKEKVRKANYISYFENHSLSTVRMIGDKKLSVSFLENMQEHEFIMDYLIFATGRSPALDFLTPEISNHLDLLQEEKKLFLIGDVKNGKFRQLSLAVGDGVRTAMEIFQHEGNHTD